MRPLSLKDDEEVVIIREAKDPYPYGPHRVFEVVFPNDKDYPNGDFTCLPVVLTAKDTLFIPEGHGQMSPDYYYMRTRPVANDLAERIALYVENYYNSDTKLVVRRKFYHGNSQRRTKCRS